MSTDGAGDAGASSQLKVFDPEHPTTTYDSTWYTWSRFFSILTSTATNRETQEYIHADAIAREEELCKRCEGWRDWLFEYSPVVRFMQEKTAMLGGELNDKNVVCRRCDSLGGGAAQLKKAAFSKDFGILLCANHLPNKGEQEDALAHEMVHAYDYMRFKYDETNLRHAACTEIRASMRAVQSVSARKDCQDDVQAVKIVNEVWENCFADTRPFDEIYR
ncbi:MAG: hypothetical protein Q9162_005872 [Coniocarpon cinnabarinum]